MSTCGGFGFVFHPGAGVFLGTFLAAVFGRDQRQNNKGDDGKYDKQRQQRPRKAPHKGGYARQDRNEPEGHDNGNMLFEFIAETLDGLFGPELYCDAPVSAGTFPRIEVPAIRAHENHNPERSRQAIYQIGPSRSHRPDGAVEA